MLRKRVRFLMICMNTLKSGKATLPSGIYLLPVGRPALPGRIFVLSVSPISSSVETSLSVESGVQGRFPMGRMNTCKSGKATLPSGIYLLPHWGAAAPGKAGYRHVSASLRLCQFPVFHDHSRLCSFMLGKRVQARPRFPLILSCSHHRMP